MQILILADNQDVTRYGMKAIAAGLYPVCVYVEALDWKSLAESLAEYPEACVVLDYTLLDCSVEQLLVLHERFPKADFVLFSDQLGRDFVRRMLLAGSSFHVLMKDAPLAEVNQCLRDVNGGCQFVCGKAKDLLREEGYFPETGSKQCARSDSLCAPCGNCQYGRILYLILLKRVFFKSE